MTGKKDSMYSCRAKRPMRICLFALIRMVSLHSFLIMRVMTTCVVFCVVPFTRGRERSRDPYSILAEATDLFQRVIGSHPARPECRFPTMVPSGYRRAGEFRSIVGDGRRNPSGSARDSRRLTPSDITNEVLRRSHDIENICKYIHRPSNPAAVASWI